MRRLLASGFHLGGPLPGVAARHGHRHRAAAARALVHKELHLHHTPEMPSESAPSAQSDHVLCRSNAAKRVCRVRVRVVQEGHRPKWQLHASTPKVYTHLLRCGRPDGDGGCRVCDDRTQGSTVGEQLVEHPRQLQPWHSTRIRAALSPGSSAVRVVSIYRPRS